MSNSVENNKRKCEIQAKLDEIKEKYKRKDVNLVLNPYCEEIFNTIMVMLTNNDIYYRACKICYDHLDFYTTVAKFKKIKPLLELICGYSGNEITLSLDEIKESWNNDSGRCEITVLPTKLMKPYMLKYGEVFVRIDYFNPDIIINKSYDGYRTLLKKLWQLDRLQEIRE